ncbi:MAG: helix-turn-helix domain-containing protein [Actinobacteria bacterium]|nr:helix-turn-helix domain-containing protein [Actinomycetota bacterium]
MEHKKTSSTRRQALEENKTLNKNSDKVIDEKFKNIQFFDPNDLIQVRYEMLRSNKKDAVSISEASKTYGFSRISFYKIKKSFEQSGLAGLIPSKRGPRSAHKLTDEVMGFVNALIKEKPDIKSSQIKERIKVNFNIKVHQRSIERAIKRAKKKQRKI